MLSSWLHNKNELNEIINNKLTKNEKIRWGNEKIWSVKKTKSKLNYNFIFPYCLFQIHSSKIYKKNCKNQSISVYVCVCLSVFIFVLFCFTFPHLKICVLFHALFHMKISLFFPPSNQMSSVLVKTKFFRWNLKKL